MLSVGDGEGVTLVDDACEGTFTTPGFDHALHNARLVDAVGVAERGERQKIKSCKKQICEKSFLQMRVMGF